MHLWTAFFHLAYRDSLSESNTKYVNEKEIQNTKNMYTEPEHEQDGYN